MGTFEENWKSDIRRVPQEYHWAMKLRNLLDLAAWLEGKGEWQSPAEVIDFFEKPWNWTADWQEFQDFLSKQQT